LKNHEGAQSGARDPDAQGPQTACRSGPHPLAPAPPRWDRLHRHTLDPPLDSPFVNFTCIYLGTSDCFPDQVEPLFNGLFRDAIGFTHIMKAAVRTHMWDACAYTFLMQPSRN
jgi:hypothetical protein